MKLLIIVCSCLTLSAVDSSTVDFALILATGRTAIFNVKQSVPSNHTVSSVVTGSPVACTLTLEGSLDGVNFFDLSSDQTCTSNLMFHVAYKPILFVRANVTALSEGATLKIWYLGR